MEPSWVCVWKLSSIRFQQLGLRMKKWSRFAVFPVSTITEALRHSSSGTSRYIFLPCHNNFSKKKKILSTAALRKCAGNKTYVSVKDRNRQKEHEGKCLLKYRKLFKKQTLYFYSFFLSLSLFGLPYAFMVNFPVEILNWFQLWTWFLSFQQKISHEREWDTKAEERERESASERTRKLWHFSEQCVCFQSCVTC